MDGCCEIVTLPAGADHAPVPRYPGARLSPARARRERLLAECERLRRWPLGDWQARIERMESEICYAAA